MQFIGNAEYNVTFHCKIFYLNKYSLAFEMAIIYFRASTRKKLYESFWYSILINWYYCVH